MGQYFQIPQSFYMWTLFISVGYMLSGELTIRQENIVLVLLSYLAAVMLLIVLVSSLSKYTFHGRLLILLAVTLSFIVGSINGRYYEMLATCALVAGAKDEDYEDILKCFFTIGTIVCVSMVIFSQLGITMDNVAIGAREDIFTEELRTRHSFGYVWPTDCATHVFFILLALWMLKKGKLGWQTSIIYVIISYLIMVYTGSRLGAGSILLLVLASMVFSIRYRENTISKVHWLSILWVPLMAILIFILTLEYDSSELNWVILDTAMSGRLGISQNAISDVGITLLGNEYKMQGGNTSAQFYNFIDSSYLQLFVLYGLLYTTVYLLLFSVIGYQAYKRYDKVMLAALLIAGFSGVIAQHFLQIFENPLLLALTATHSMAADGELSEVDDEFQQEEDALPEYNTASLQV